VNRPRYIEDVIDEELDFSSSNSNSTMDNDADIDALIMNRLITVGPPAQPGDLPAAPLTNRVPNETQTLISELVRQLKNVHVESDVLTWSQFIELPFSKIMDKLRDAPMNNLKISDRDAFAIQSLVVQWPDRENISDLGLRHLCLQMVLHNLMLQYGWQYAIKTMKNISEQIMVDGRTMSLADHRDNLRKAQGRPKTQNASKNATRPRGGTQSQRSQRSSSRRRSGNNSQARGSQRTNNNTTNASSQQRGNSQRRSQSQSRRTNN
jgi:hypothetical protein